MNNYVFNNQNKKFLTVFFCERLEIKNELDIIKSNVSIDGNIVNKIKLNDNLYICILGGNLTVHLQYINDDDIVLTKKFKKDFFDEINIPKSYFMKNNVNFNFKVKEFFYKLTNKNELYLSACIEINFL